MIRKQELIGVSFLAFLLLSVVLTNPTQIVLADEAEETDYFTQMPNYRWENQSTTDTAVHEQLLGNYYETYNANNETSDTQAFAKSRKLNSRDLYFDSRFMVETGGDEVEYFSDVVGDPCDFTEGDQEGSMGNSLDNDLVENGIFSGNPNGAYNNINIYGISLDISVEVYNRFVVRYNYVRSSGTIYSFVLYVTNELGSGKYVSLGIAITDGNWHILNVQLTDSDWVDGRKITSLYLRSVCTTPSHATSDLIAIDYIQLFEDLEYSTHVEGEVEDTWDWEDSNEYFYDSYDNISDFNDGTTEQCVEKLGTTIKNENGWLVAEDINLVYVDFSDTLTIDASVYKWLTYEFTSNESINYITYYDVDDNAIGADLTVYAADTKYLVSKNLGLDADWTGTEDGFYIEMFNVLNEPNKIELNFTFLYDVELGDTEEWYAMERMHTNPEGFYTVSTTAGSIDELASPTGQVIYPDIFSTMIIRMKVSDPTMYFQIKGYNGVDYITLTHIDYLSTSWSIYTLDLNEAGYWYDSEYWGRFNIRLDESDGILDGDESVNVDYILVTGEWSDESEFTYSLLNQNDEEGLSIGFNRFNLTNNDYYLNVSLYDSIGIAEEYSTTFTYDYTSDGWLFIDFEFDLDKKEIKFLLEYENGTDILKTRLWTDLFTNIGTQQLLLFETGFPQLCLNASTDSFERVWFLIDYIDANYDNIEWRHPSGSHTSSAYIYSDTFSQDVWTFDAVSPYGMAVYSQDIGSSKEQWYMIDVDRFDGINFDVEATGKLLDPDDEQTFTFEAFNVKKNGSLEWVYTLQWTSLTFGSSGGGFAKVAVWIPRDNSLRYLGFSNDVQYFTSSMSFYYESPDKVILQTTFDTNETEPDSNQMTFEPINEADKFTKEWVFYHSFSVTNTNDGYNSDEMSIKIGGFDLTRKDILGDIAGAILSPIVNVLSIIFAPVFLLLQFLGFVITRGLKFVVDILGPIITLVGTTISGALTAAFSALSVVLDTALGEIGGFIDDVAGFIDDVADAIAGFGEAIVTAIGGAFGNFIAAILELASDAADLLLAILDFLFVLLLDSIELVIDLICAGLIFLWNLFGLPDLGPLITQLIDMFFDVITGIPQLITDISEWIFFFGSFVLVIWWAWCVLLPIASLDPGEAMGQIVDRFFAGIFPWDILGIHFYIPQGIVMIGLTYFLIIAPTGAGIAIW